MKMRMIWKMMKKITMNNQEVKRNRVLLSMKVQMRFVQNFFPLQISNNYLALNTKSHIYKKLRKILIEGLKKKY